MIPSALIPTADGFEEIELVSIVDILRRAGAYVALASVTSSLHVTGGHGISIKCDSYLHDFQTQNWDMITLAGGTKNAETLEKCQLLIEMLKNQKNTGRWYASICASPALVFEPHNLLEGEKATCYPKFFERLREKGVNERVVVSNKCITGKGPGCSTEFALTLVEKLFNKQKALEIAKALIFKK